VSRRWKEAALGGGDLLARPKDAAAVEELEKSQRCTKSSRGP